MKQDLWLRVGCPNLTNNKVFLVAVLILLTFNVVLYFQNIYVKNKKKERVQQKQVPSYRMGPVYGKGLPCQCIQTFDLWITEKVINSTMCSKESAMTGKFHRKVISYSYYENNNEEDPSNDEYFYGIEKHLLAIKQNYGQGWTMRLYFALSKLSAEKTEFLCGLACKYHEEFELCNVEKNPRYGNLAHIEPQNWPFLTTLDSQVDIAFSRDLSSLLFEHEMGAVKKFLKSSSVYYSIKDLPQHHVPIMVGMWGVKLTPQTRAKMYDSFKTMTNPENLILHWAKDYWWISPLIIFVLLVLCYVVFGRRKNKTTLISHTNLKSTKLFLGAVMILSTINLVLYCENVKNQTLNMLYITPSYKLEPMGQCGCIHTSDNRITDQVIKSTMCSKESAMSGKFHRKVISYSYYEGNQENSIYFDGIQKNLLAIKANYGQGWSMRLYVEMSKLPYHKRKSLCDLACQYPDEFEICDVEKTPKYGDISHIFPMNWRFLTMLDSQVDITFSRDLDSLISNREVEAVKQYLRSPKEFHFMRDLPDHDIPILGGMWGVKLTPKIEAKIYESFRFIFDSDLFYKDHNSKGPDQDILRMYIWPWAKDFAMAHDSYYCKKYASEKMLSRAFPTERKDDRFNFVGCKMQEDCRLYFNYRTECPPECRPKHHPDWKYC